MRVTMCISFFLCTLFFSSPLVVLAQSDPLEADRMLIEGQVNYHNDDVNKQTAAFTGAQGAGFERVRDPRDAVAQVIQGFLVLLGTVFLVYALYAGYLILTSAGNEDRVEKGKRILRDTTIGLMIILSAYGTTWIVRSFFVASGDDTYKNCHPPAYEEFNPDPLNQASGYTGC